MRIPAGATYTCTFPDFDEGPEDRAEIEASDAQEAAVRAAGWWENSIDDYQVLRGEDVLRIHVQGVEGLSVWGVLGERGRYVAKQMED